MIAIRWRSSFSCFYHLFWCLKNANKGFRWNRVHPKTVAINHVNRGDDSRSPASSMAAVNLGSWFPSLGQRPSSCAPRLLPLTQQMWSDHRGDCLTTSGSDYLQTIQLYQLHPLRWALLRSFSQRWCVTHSQLTNTGFTGWFICI